MVDVWCGGCPILHMVWWMSGVVDVWCGGCLTLHTVWWMSGVVDVCVVDVVQSKNQIRRCSKTSVKCQNFIICLGDFHLTKIIFCKKAREKGKGYPSRVQSPDHQRGRASAETSTDSLTSLLQVHCTMVETLRPPSS